MREGEGALNSHVAVSTIGSGCIRPEVCPCNEVPRSTVRFKTRVRNQVDSLVDGAALGHGDDLNRCLVSVQYNLCKLRNSANPTHR